MRLDDRLSDGLRETLREAGRIAAECDASAWLVGGPVRDLLLGRQSPDIDIAVEGDVERVGRALAGRLDGEVRKSTQFMTATVELPGGEVDLARTRSERYPEPGALPEVEPAPLREDLARRDFTVNAMAMALSPRWFGTLIDPHEGLGDLRKRRLRVLHERSFEDDPTRALRAVRFMLRLDFELEERTADLLLRAAREGRLAELSGARLRNELRTIFAEAPAEGLAALEQRGLLEAMGLGAADDGALSAARRLPRAIAALGVDPDELRPIAACLGLHAALLGADAAAMGERLMLDAGERADMRQAAELAKRPPDELSRKCADSELFFALTGTSAAAAAACWTVLDAPERARLERYWRELRGASADIDGHDLKAAGYEPGPAFGDALDEALAAKLDLGADRAGQLRAATRILRGRTHTDAD